MMRKLSLVLTVSIFALSFSSCEENLAYYNTYPQGQKKMDVEVPIQKLIEASTVDIIWVIDNSGSMSDYQQQVILNTANFLNLFSQRKLDWKMGLISTDESDPPFIGFDPLDPLNSTQPDAVDRFKRAVADLGTGGSGSEETLSPLVNKLRSYPNFLRNGAMVALIFVTDAEEQSDRRDWLNEFRTVASTSSNVYGYGVFASIESGCQTEESSWNFAGSPYETFFKGLTEYKTFKICQDFGQNLSEIGNDLIQRSNYWISIPFRPKKESIKVYYKDTLLKAGPKEDGGFWYYDYERNAITLYGFEFAEVTDSIHVYAEEDDGIER